MSRARQTKALEPQAHQPEAQAPQAAPKPKRQLRAVFGTFIDPFTNVAYTATPVDAQDEIKEGSWLDVQIKHGKIEFV